MNIISDKEFQKMIGKKRATTWRYRRDGLIAFTKLGGGIFYTQEQIETFIKENSIRISRDWKNPFPDKNTPTKGNKNSAKEAKGTYGGSIPNRQGEMPAETCEYCSSDEKQF